MHIFYDIELVPFNLILNSKGKIFHSFLYFFSNDLVYNFHHKHIYILAWNKKSCGDRNPGELDFNEFMINDGMIFWSTYNTMFVYVFYGLFLRKTQNWNELLRKDTFSKYMTKDIFCIVQYCHFFLQKSWII